MRVEIVADVRGAVVSPEAFEREAADVLPTLAREYGLTLASVTVTAGSPVEPAPRRRGILSRLVRGGRR